VFSIHSIPKILKRLFPAFVWNMPASEKAIYLTFDDGPIPEITDFVLDQLKSYQAKATFFCVGENINKHPEIFHKIENEGHAIGNHTYNHIKGWEVVNDLYFHNIDEWETAAKSNSKSSVFNCQLFRPPYGRILSSQAKVLREKYKIIMWDVLTCDYNKNLDPEKCLKNSIKVTNPGSIVVFHDSLKAEKNLKYILPRYLQHFANLGFKFKSIS
jgi:peptidoglycan/xylan/chitin deacetylase (PgdA/CDA1 family)